MARAKKQKEAGKMPAVQTATEGAAEASAAGGRYAEESPKPATPPPASSTPKTPAGADAPGSAGRSKQEDEERGAGSEERKDAGETPAVQAPPAAFNVGAAPWQRYRIHGERGPVVEICRSAAPVYIKSAHGVMLCDEGCLIGRYPERPDELFVVSETDFDAVAYKGKPGASIVDERVTA